MQTNEPQNEQATDPVCGMTVDRATAADTSEYRGETYYFCSAGCKRQFDKDPQRFLPIQTL
jgi:YHS domain-containing protein